MTPGIALATYFALAVVLFGLLASSSRGLDASTREQMRRWISRGSDTPARGDQEWAAGFVRWFDHAFRVKTRKIPGLGELPLPSFWRSVLVSFLSLFVLALVWFTNKPGMARMMEYGELGGSTGDMMGRLVLVYGSATLVTNWLPDYLSLVESRLIMGKMARASSWTRRFAWLGLDAAATLAISFFAIHIGMLLILPLVSPMMDIEVGCLTPETYSLATTWELFVAGLRFEGPAGTLNYDATGIYVYSTFLTSLWVWFYIGGGFVLRALYACRAKLGSGAGSRSGGEAPSAIGSPLRAMGILFIVTFSAIFWPSWVQRRATSADVYIEHVAADSEAARELAAELEAAGLRVRTRADSSEAHAAELLTRAGAVIVLDSMATRATYDGEESELEAVAAELFMMGDCGERPWGSSARVSLGERDRVGLAYNIPPTDRYGASLDWHPGQDSRELVRWAQEADAVLHPGQVRACQTSSSRTRRPAPAACTTRR